MSVLVLCLLIAGLLVIRVPVSFAFFGPCLLYMITTDQSVGLALRLVASSTASFPLLAVPLFILLGCIANHAGIADRLFDFALALLGRVRGSLGYVSVGVSLGFSWMSGSAVADAAALGKVEIPAMLRAGYPKPFALGVVGSSALIAPVMPPSIPAVIYAGLAGVSTGALFAASVVPALLMALGLCVVVFLWVRRMPNLERTEFEWGRVWVTGRRVIAPLGAPVIILGGILGGYVTPTEAAAVGAAYMALLGIAYRTLRLRDVPKILVEATVTTGSIMLIVASANLLGYVFARERVPQDLSEAMLGLTSNATVFLLVVFALSMVLGTALDAVAVLTLTVPILQPLALLYDVDPIALGVLMIVSQMIGLLTPPVGTVIFVLQAIIESHDVGGLLGLGAVPGAADADLPGDHLLARRDPVPAREVGAVTGQATPRSWLAGLIGQGVGPSLTPELHEREAQRQGLRYVYKVVEQPAGPLDTRRLERLLAGAIELGFDGLNVTHPVKQAMVPLVDERRLRGRGDRSAQHGPDPRRPYDGPQHGRDRLSPGLRARAPRRRPRLRPAARRRRRRHRRRARPRAARCRSGCSSSSRTTSGQRRSGVPSARSRSRSSSRRSPGPGFPTRWRRAPESSTRARWGWRPTRARRCRTVCSDRTCGWPTSSTARSTRRS